MKKPVHILICALVLLAPACAMTGRAVSPNILVLNSYHPGYAWSDDEITAILNALRDYDSSIPVFVEYLDTKRLGNRPLLQKQARFLKEKYELVPISLLVTCDNNALEFAIEHRATIAPAAPIVFCGINAFTPGLLRGETNVIGVVENTDAHANIALVRKLCPWATRLFIVNDFTETGRANHSAFEAVADEYAPELTFIFNDNISLEDLLNQVRHLPEDTIVMLDVFLVDAQGRYYEPNEIGQLVSRNSSVPVFNLNEPTFQGGGIGGALAMPALQGQTAAQLVIRLLEGARPSELPLTLNGPLRLIFDYRELLRHNLNEGNLPDGALVINQPESIYTHYPPLTAAAITLLIALLVLVFLLLRNIISRRNSERELARQRQLLEHQVAERTRKLEEARTGLEQRAAELARANEYKSLFLAHISHEVRTPLSAIIGFAEIILYSSSIDFIYQQSQIILNEAEHLLTIINQLLDHAKMDAGKFELEHKPFDLHHLLDDMHKSLHHHAQRKQLQLHFDYSQAPQHVIGDPLRLRQVLLNLLTNAIKFTQQGTVDLAVRRIEGNSRETSLRFSVRDTGIGIPPEALKDIFSRFSQVDRSVTRRFGGTGLGTSIAYALVELMGGHLQVQSQSGKGSNFWFDISLPLAADVSPEQLAALSPISVSIQDQTPVQGAHILIVDDYASNQSIVRIHLENAGYTCVVAENGREALAACSGGEAFSLILMDISMPVMDGYEATRRIRNSPTVNARIPILALSAHAGDHVRKKCLEAGMNDIIIKPIHRSSFLQQVDHWLTINELALRPQQRVKPHPASPPPLPLADRDIPLRIPLLVHEFAGNKDLAAEALNYFIKDVRLLLPKIVKACQDLDMEYIMKEAHKISGSAGNLRAMRVARHAKQLEELCSDGHPNPGEVMNFVSQLINSFEELTTYLDEQRFLPP